MAERKSRSFMEDFKQFFLRGLVVLLPSVLTLWICVKAYQFIDNAIAAPINGGVRHALVQDWLPPISSSLDQNDEAIEEALIALPQSERNDLEAARQKVRLQLREEQLNEWWTDHTYMNLFGLVVAIIVVYVAGWLLGGFVGRRLYRRLEKFFTRIPVVKQVYPYVKQIVDFLFSDDQPIKFNRVVAVEYPRVGIWSVGFLTGGALKSVADKAGDCRTVFIPSSPTPFTGYTITVPAEELIELPISVEEAIRFAVSGGVLVPAHQVDPNLGEDAASMEEMTGLTPIPPLYPEDDEREKEQNNT